jgi:hypothetical protein
MHLLDSVTRFCQLAIKWYDEKTNFYKTIFYTNDCSIILPFH